MKKIFHRPFFIRLFNWEYWSFGAVYTLIIPYWLYLCFKARSFFFFVASNPSITNGGLLGESKKDIHAILPPDLFPNTIHFAMGTDPDEVLRAVSGSGMKLPVIGKPDIGGKGRGVKILRSAQDIKAYAANALLDFHIQQLVPYPLEAGIFYYRIPGEEKGHITGIVSKHFLTVTGNGKDDLGTLIRNDKRGIMFYKGLASMHAESLHEVLAEGEKKLVSPFGNHARGSLFLDDTHIADQQLTDMIDAISKRIPGFYFGRFDIRYSSLDLLKQGREFTVIELNGAGAEPTHIYDPGHSIFFAWKEIIRHWSILCRISMINHRNGVPYPRFMDGLAIFTKEKEDSEKLAGMST